MRNVVVTGGSRGLGLAISIKLAAAGYCAIAIARKESRELASAIAASARAGTRALQFLPFDLGDIDAMPRFVAALRCARASGRSTASSTTRRWATTARCRSCIPRRSSAWCA
jgi:NAD(P)-dependent dehydrogenase (short-subunit alcohol dehydrogenase family)